MKDSPVLMFLVGFACGAICVWFFIMSGLVLLGWQALGPFLVILLLLIVSAVLGRVTRPRRPLPDRPAGPADADARRTDRPETHITTLGQFRDRQSRRHD